MSNLMYEMSVKLATRNLENLLNILDKANTYSQERKLDETVIGQLRLFPDMLPFARQVQLVSDFTKNGTARLAGQTPPKFEDTEKTIPELISRIKKTLEFVTSLKAEAFAGAENKDITFPVGPEKTVTTKGLAYLQIMMLPNIFFHYTTAYDILRHNGVAIGKSDFIGEF